MRTLIIISIGLFCGLNSISQNVIFNKNDKQLQNNIRLKISTEKDLFHTGDTIWIDYTFLNTSDSTQHLLLKEYWEHPMGMTASIINENDSNICKYPTRTYYSSRLFLESELVEFYKNIEPDSVIKGKVALQVIPAFKDYIQNGLIPTGKYKVNLGYYILLSNTMHIEIKD